MWKYWYVSAFGLYYSIVTCLFISLKLYQYIFFSLLFLVLWLSWYLGSLVLLLEITFISVTICDSESHSVVSDSLRPYGLYSPWNSPGQNTGVGSPSLLQGIFPTQGSNPCLPHCRGILYQLRHKGSLSMLEWVAYPFSRGSSRPGNRIGVSCIAGGFFTNTGGFFTNWAIREALTIFYTLNHLFFKNYPLFSVIVRFVCQLV